VLIYRDWTSAPGIAVSTKTSINMMKGSNRGKIVLHFMQEGISSMELTCSKAYKSRSTVHQYWNHFRPREHGNVLGGLFPVQGEEKKIWILCKLLQEFIINIHHNWGECCVNIIRKIIRSKDKADKTHNSYAVYLNTRMATEVKIELAGVADVCVDNSSWGQDRV